MKIIFTLIALCGAVTAFAQIEKGMSVLTGNISLSGGDQATTTDANGVSSTVNSKSKGFGTSISYGYFVANNWVIGLRGSYGVNRSDLEGNNSKSMSRASNTGMAIYTRRYFLIAERFYFHVEGGLSYSYGVTNSKVDTDPVWNSETTATSVIYVNPGLTYFVTKKFAVTANIGSANYTKQESKESQSTYRYSSTRKAPALSFSLTSIGLSASLFF